MSVQIGARIPEGHRKKLEGIAAASGRTVSQVIGEAIAHYIGEGDPASLSSRLLVIERRVDALEEGQRAVKALIP
ncbi:ribbon-helix-helix domain-containing protein [Leptolyngbya sp. PL-A3]|uniref:DNA-binding domain-containing protein n=1 Tax=Leptolyngbya sp. PL-A3 TaxID=2933911 RepID=UPI0032971528